jgi:hypothetical protein
LRSPTFIRRSYAVLASLSTSYPPLQGTFRYVTHPFATRHQGCPRAAVRLACVRHAASVQSEPGSNSSVQSLFRAISGRFRCDTEPSLTQNTDSFVLANLSVFLLREHLLYHLSIPAYQVRQCTPSSAHTYRLLVFKELQFVLRRPLMGRGCEALCSSAAER